MKNETIIYSVPAPFSSDQHIEVYGERDMGSYEWRLIAANGEVVSDTHNQGYGIAEIALRDALIQASN